MVNFYLEWIIQQSKAKIRFICTTGIILTWLDVYGNETIDHFAVKMCEADKDHKFSGKNQFALGNTIEIEQIQLVILCC